MSYRDQRTRRAKRRCNVAATTPVSGRTRHTRFRDAQLSIRIRTQLFDKVHCASAKNGKPVRTFTRSPKHARRQCHYREHPAIQYRLSNERQSQKIAPFAIIRTTRPFVNQYVGLTHCSPSARCCVGRAADPSWVM